MTLSIATLGTRVGTPDEGLGGIMIGRGDRRRRWAIGGLIAYGAAVCVVLVAPVSYAGIVQAIAGAAARVFGLDWFGSGWIEFAANILMFAPLGFLLTVLLPRWGSGFILAVALSVAAEVVQVVIPSRQPSLRDILANALGAAIGALLAWLLVGRRRARASSAQALDGARGDAAEL